MYIVYKEIHLYMVLDELFKDLLPNGVPEGGAGFPICRDTHFYGAICFLKRKDGVIPIEVYDSMGASEKEKHGHIRDLLRSRKSDLPA